MTIGMIQNYQGNIQMSIEKPKPPQGRVTVSSFSMHVVCGFLSFMVPLVVGFILLGTLACKVHSAESNVEYDRSEWGIWRTKACKTTRELVLIEQGQRVVLSANGCDVVSGLWYDVYSDWYYDSPKAIDIDHVVPTHWAFTHGANKWTRRQRINFANDINNLQAVGSSANRSKGDDGPIEWMPSSVRYHCDYLKRFNVIVRRYKLRYHNGEGIWMVNKLNECKKK